MKGWPKLKLGQAEVNSNIARNDWFSPKEVIYLIIICPKSHDILTKNAIK